MHDPRQRRSCSAASYACSRSTSKVLTQDAFRTLKLT
jgi:hypothetical protein